jgi:hypothetical protein
MTLDEIKNDPELRPYFLEFICKNMVLGMTDFFHVNDLQRIKFQKEFYDSMLNLSERLESVVPQDRIYPTIEEVSKFYLQAVGRVGFDQYPTNN